MSEIIKNTYKTLFSVNVLHHYFLDNGRIIFLFDKTKQQPELKDYDVRRFLSIMPIAPTQQVLKKLGAIYRATSMGFVVIVPIDVEVKVELTFVIIPTDPLFSNYTPLTLKGQEIEAYEVKEEDEIKRFRVKNNVFVLTNNGKNTHTLSEKVPTQTDNSFAIEEFFEAGGELFQAIKDEAGADFREKIAKPLNGNLPLFVNQEDIPTRKIKFVKAETTPGGDTIWKDMEKTIQGIVLTEDIPDDVFALLRIDTSTNHFINPVEPLQFEVHFKSRSTYWHYFDKTDQRFKPENPDFWGPLTLKGGRTSKRKAPPDRIKQEKDGNGKTVKLISEINP